MSDSSKRKSSKDEKQFHLDLKWIMVLSAAAVALILLILAVPQPKDKKKKKKKKEFGSKERGFGSKCPANSGSPLIVARH